MIPNPNGSLRRADGHFPLRRSLKANPGGFSGECLAAFSERTGVQFEVTEENADFILVRDDALPPEGYSLDVTRDAVTINAKAEAGVILALTTLYVNLDPDGIPCFHLDDEPRYSYRGLMLDCVRHFFSVGEIKKIIEQMSLAKLNKLHWHLTDDQGWRIESEAYPALHEGIPHYTRSEIRDIVRYARARNVEVIPEIDMPGHSTSAIHVMPWLSCAERQVRRADSGGIYKTILCAGKESTFEFVFKILDEVTELFESPQIHIGGDEAPKIEWRECPACKKRLVDIGSEDFEDLQGYFTNRVAEYLKSKGKKVICWNETLRADKLPDDLTIQYWMPGEDDTKAADFLNAGRPLIFSDMFKLYFDYPHVMTPLQNVYNYVPSIGGKPCGEIPCVLGLEACLWSERVDTEQKLEELIFPRVFALAEAAWSREKDYGGFERRLEERIEQLREQGICHTLPEQYNPDGNDKLIGIRTFAAGYARALENKDDNKVDLTESFGGEKLGRFLIGFGLDPQLARSLLG